MNDQEKLERESFFLAVTKAYMTERGAEEHAAYERVTAAETRNGGARDGDLPK